MPSVGALVRRSFAVRAICDLAVNKQVDENNKTTVSVFICIFNITVAIHTATTTVTAGAS